MADAVGAEIGDLREMRLAVQLAFRQLPHPRKGDIVHHQPAIGSEDGDALIQRVQSRFLHLVQQVEGGFQPQPLGNVLEQDKEISKLPWPKGRCVQS